MRRSGLYLSLLVMFFMDELLELRRLRMFFG